MADAYRDSNNVPTLLGVSNADGFTPVRIYSDPTTHRLLVDASVTVSGITGTKSNNAGVPGATNLGTLPAVATAAAPSYTEGNQVGLSTDLAGALRVTGSLSVGGTTDNSVYTAGSSTGTPTFGFYHSVIDTVTDGRSASVAITSKRALMVNLQTSAGAETGVAAVPLQVSLANTGANATKILVTPDSVALPANQSVNVSQINGVTPLMGNGVTGTGSQRVTIASDNTAFSVNATLSAETTKVIGTVNIAAAQTIGITANSSVNVAQMNGVATSMGAGANGTGVQRVTLATDQTAVTTAGVFSVKLDQTTVGTTNAVSLAQIGTNAIVTAGVNGTQAVGGSVATNVAIGTNPINLGAQAVSAENTAVTATRMAQLVTDLVGKLIVLPYANPENFVSGAITTAMTGTTSTSLIAAPAAGLRNYITQITVSNSHATVGTDVIIQDGNAGTTLYTIPAAAVYGGAVVVFPTPLRQPTTATAIYCANVTTGSSIKVSASGYKGA